MNTVYPRWRGELFFVGDICTDIDGLSPLARGTRQPAGRARGADRFIPAGAGNSQKRQVIMAAIMVYPRWRGELAFCSAV